MDFSSILSVDSRLPRMEPRPLDVEVLSLEPIFFNASFMSNAWAGIAANIITAIKENMPFFMLICL